MNIPYLINDFVKSKSLQEFVNHRFKDDSKIILSKNGIFKIIGTDGGLFHLDDMWMTIEQAAKDYDYSDLRVTDRVLDIGACVGGFSIPTAKKVKWVYAVEPVLFERLNENIRLNKILNISVFPCAMGTGTLNLDWCGYKRTVQGFSLSELILKCGGHIDFLKCDCEGGEWCIKPEELQGIRRIEMEIHGKDYDEILAMLAIAGFNQNVNIIRNDLVIVHARSTVIK